MKDEKKEKKWVGTERITIITDYISYSEKTYIVRRGTEMTIQS